MQRDEPPIFTITYTRNDPAVSMIYHLRGASSSESRGDMSRFVPPSRALDAVYGAPLHYEQGTA